MCQICPSLSYKNYNIKASHRLQDEITKTQWHGIANSGSAKIDVRSLAEIVERCGVPQVGQVILVFMTTCATTMLLPFRGPQTFRYSLGDPAKFNLALNLFLLFLTIRNNQRTILMERALGRRNRAEILACVPRLQALELGKNSLRPYGWHYSNDLTSL
ncbi:hypothetical protein J6590_070286 [Homalodisca vitripennis]|nr:hypothetical protein J6590_070286 [Homalodisca vitripennis]